MRGVWVQRGTPRQIADHSKCGLCITNFHDHQEALLGTCRVGPGDILNISSFGSRLWQAANLQMAATDYGNCLAKWKLLLGHH